MPNNLFAPRQTPEDFVGRHAEMEWLEREVYSAERGDANLPIVIRGEAGIGKSSFVAQFLTRHAERVWPIWIPCRNWETVGPAFEATVRQRDLEGPRQEAVIVLDGVDETSEKNLTEMFFKVARF